MHFFEKILGFSIMFFWFLQFLFLVLTQVQQKKVLKGEKQITGFDRYHKSHKWLKANIENLSEHKQIGYKKYLFKRKLFHISLSIFFLLCLIGIILDTLN